MPKAANEFPKGFQIEPDDSGHLTITYKTVGMGCFHWFLATLLAIVGGTFGLVTYRNPAGMRQLFDGWFAWICLACGLLAMIYFASFLTFHLFGSTVLSLDPTKLVIQKRLFGLKSTKSVHRDKMEFLEQIKDGGEGEDSFPSWGLNLMSAGRRFKLLTRQQIDKSGWLGRKLADYFGIEFKNIWYREE